MADGAPIAAGMELFENETGDTWWILGHHPDDEAIAAVRVHMAGIGCEDWDDADVAVTRGYWRDAQDPTTDERWDRCDKEADGAMPFTRVDV